MGFLSEFLVWSLVVFGSVNGIVVSLLFRSFRDWLSYSYIERAPDGAITAAVARKFQFFGKLINCPMCVGFWAGMLWGWLFWSPADNMILHTPIYCDTIELLANAFLGSIVSWLLYIVIAKRQFSL